MNVLSDQVERDWELVCSCLKGDVTAWEALYHDYQPRLAAFLRDFLGPQADYNLVDEIIARVWYALVAHDRRLLRRFDPSRGCRLITYLTIVARSEATALLRSELSRRHREWDATNGQAKSRQNSEEFSPIEFDEFRQELTPRERAFLEGFLLAPLTKENRIAFTNANKWQLCSRVLRKLRDYLRHR